MNHDLILNFDGAAEPTNPGEGSYGVVARWADNPGVSFKHVSVAIGWATNNEAEWAGLIGALKVAREVGGKRVLIRGDSKLIINQVTGRWKVKKPHLQALYDQAQELIKDFELVTFKWVPRESNEEADAVADWTMDASELSWN